MELKNKKYLVVGLGKTGIATARFLMNRGARVALSDSRASVGYEDEIAGFKDAGMIIELGGHTEKTFLWPDVIILSPGVPFTLPYVQMAYENGIEVISEIELASKFITKPVVGITGSNGKTTTTTMIYHILEASGLKVFLGGNIGTPLIEIADDDSSYDYILLELSSFQLQGIKEFKPYIAVCLNIYPNHLDHHKDFKEYVDAKTKIFINQDINDFSVINCDDSVLREKLHELKSKKIKFGKSAGCDACFDDATVYYDDSEYELGALKLVGRHNIENATAAIIVSRLLGCSPDVIKKSILGFNSLPHRIEYVREYNNAKFYNDSKSTTPHSTLKALEAFDPPVILITGGKDKGLDYSVFIGEVTNKVKQLILMGESSAKMKDVFGGCVPLLLANSLDKAIEYAVDNLEQGDTILFSPACSSFDMFSSYEERGRKFKEIVECL